MDLRHLRYFLALAEQHNFTRAAEVLHITQPTLSHQIRQLEEELNVTFFDRSGRTVNLTDHGIAFEIYARRCLREIEAGRRSLLDVKTLERGELRIAVTPTFTAYFIGPLLQSYRKEYPGINIKVSEMNAVEVETALKDDAVDLGIAFMPNISDEIDAQPLFDEELALLVTSGNPLARYTELSPSELEQSELALLPMTFATRLKIESYFTEHRIAPRVAVEVNTIGAIIAIVLGGQLGTILPIGIVNTQPELKAISLTNPPCRTAALLSRRGSYRSAAAQALERLLLSKRLTTK